MATGRSCGQSHATYPRIPSSGDTGSFSIAEYSYKHGNMLAGAAHPILVLIFATVNLNGVHVLVSVAFNHEINVVKSEVGAVLNLIKGIANLSVMKKPKFTRVLQGKSNKYKKHSVKGQQRHYRTLRDMHLGAEREILEEQVPS
ncbi:hypothetical protein P154DRAFT_562224 [Amniculicola lignicola CBS 123094]|uniref:Uncharacterized protein n=1 Tax=Amniculicola lignicola CBS 123094 TaxID=1392246 RepID=A0A6A5WJN3_9PLEO|nr:hypothetical protein P154DRAFT_562224 [Amniculicola lignicola CBS 123094]